MRASTLDKCGALERADLSKLIKLPESYPKVTFTLDPKVTRKLPTKGKSGGFFTA